MDSYTLRPGDHATRTPGPRSLVTCVLATLSTIPTKYLTPDEQIDIARAGRVCGSVRTDSLAFAEQRGIVWGIASKFLPENHYLGFHPVEDSRFGVWPWDPDGEPI